MIPIIYYGKSTTGAQLWSTTGGAGTLVQTINASVGDTVYNLTAGNNALYFEANDGTNGYEPWVSQGSASNTVMLRDIYTSGNSYPYNFFKIGGLVYFAAQDAARGTELWSTSGTSASTLIVKDVNPGSGASSPSYFVNLNGQILFQAYNPNYGYELWKSDGTTLGTSLVKDIYAGTTSSSPAYLLSYNGAVYFSATDAANGAELWKSDGTSGGTVLLKDINPGAGANGNPYDLTRVGTKFFFAGSDATHGSELWISNGTSAGTVIVKDVYSGTTNSGISNITDLNGVAYFTANDGVHGYELWKSDGTTLGTSLVIDLNNAGSSSSNPYNLTKVGNLLYFVASDGTNSYQLWKTDGVTTSMVKLINLSGSANPINLTNVNGTLYFEAYDGTQYNLYKTDGTAAGTVMLDSGVNTSGGIAAVISSTQNDFTGDGTSDILWFNTNSGAVLDWALVNGAFSRSTTIAGFAPGSGWSIIGTGDFSGDNSADVLLSYVGAGQTTIADWNVTSGAYASFSTLGGFGSTSGWAEIGVGDFNADGTSDVLLSFTGGGSVSLYDFRVFGGATVATDNLNMGFSTSSGWTVIGTGDFNSDGTADILFQNTTSGLVADWSVVNGTAGAFTSIAGIAPGGGWNFLGVGDFNGDGTSDLLWRNGSTLAIWEVQNGALLHSITVSTPAPTGYAFEAIGDYMGNGTSDILWQNTTSGATLIWAMQNGQEQTTTTPGSAAPSSGWRIAG